MDGSFAGPVGRAAPALLVLTAMIVAARADARTVTALEVRVTRDGQPVASAVVCVGTTANRALYGQKLTDSFGRARLDGVPPLPFVVTAGASGRGTEVTFSRLSVGPSTLIVPLALPVSGGPACPAATDDSLRMRIVSGVVLTPPTVPSIEALRSCR